jgi:pimeloyl-ACP methyl ester carboxylesterase
MIMRYLKKAFIFGGLAALGLILVAIIVGLTYERLARGRAAAEFPRQAKMIDIGGRRIQLDCRSTGTPTIVFESGLDINGSLSWDMVQDTIAQTTRTCSYSRAGIMWSDRSDRHQNGKAIAEDLHAALAEAGEKPSFVLVGHSLGGPYIMTFTKYYGAEVAGLVFVDASHPDMLERMKPISLSPLKTASQQVLEKLAGVFEPLGVARALYRPVPGMYNLDSQRVFAITAYGPVSILAASEEAESLKETLAEAGSFRQLGSRPIVVLTGTKSLDPATLSRQGITAEQSQLRSSFNEMHAEMATWSSRGERRLVPNSGHYIQLEQPDVVIEAVRSTIDRVRTMR